MAEKGKLEFKLVATPGATKESEKDWGLEKVLNMPPSMLMKTLLTQGKVLEKCSEELEIKKEEVKTSIAGNENIKAKFDELSKEKVETEAEIKKILEEEKNLFKRFGQMDEMLENLCKSQPTEQLREKIVKYYICYLDCN